MRVDGDNILKVQKIKEETSLWLDYFARVTISIRSSLSKAMYSSWNKSEFSVWSTELKASLQSFAVYGQGILRLSLRKYTHKVEHEKKNYYQSKNQYNGKYAEVGDRKVWRKHFGRFSAQLSIWRFGVGPGIENAYKICPSTSPALTHPRRGRQGGRGRGTLACEHRRISGCPFLGGEKR